MQCGKKKEGKVWKFGTLTSHALKEEVVVEELVAAMAQSSPLAAALLAAAPAN